MSKQLKSTKRKKRRQGRSYKPGLYKSKFQVESKYWGDYIRKDLYLVAPPTTEGNVVNSFCEVPLGVDAISRIGKTINISSVHVRGELKGQPFYTGLPFGSELGVYRQLFNGTHTVKVVLVQDTEPNDVFTPLYEIFEAINPDYQLVVFKNLTLAARYKILATEILEVNPRLTVTYGGHIPSPLEAELINVTRDGFSKYFEMNINFKEGLRVDYDQASPNLKSRTNRILLFALTEKYWFEGQEGSEFVVEILPDFLLVNWRIRFNDC